MEEKAKATPEEAVAIPDADEMIDTIKNLDTETISHLINTYVIPWGKNIIFAIIIYIVGKLVAKYVRKLIMKAVRRTAKDEMLENFISSIIGAILTLFVIIASISQLGVNTSSLIALIGAAGLAVGLALQDSMKNFAAGVMILIFKPFKKGDYIEAAGQAGTVNDISIFTMAMKSPDNKQIIIPNGSVLSSSIINYSNKATRRVDLVFGIGYDDDIKEAKKILQELLAADSRVLKDPKPLVAVAELADSSVNFNVRPWVKSSDYWAVYYDITEQVKISFDNAGITIPYPQIDLNTKK